MEEQFGQEYKVVAAHMKVLKDGPRIKEGDSESMHKLATQMRNCHITLTEWGFEANLNNHDTTDQIFLRLPLSHQREFQKKTASLFAAGKEPDFKVLMEFVQNQAMQSNTRFSQMLHTRKDSDFTYTVRLEGGLKPSMPNLSRKTLPSKLIMVEDKFMLLKSHKGVQLRINVLCVMTHIHCGNALISLNIRLKSPCALLVKHTCASIV